MHGRADRTVQCVQSHLQAALSNVLPGDGVFLCTGCGSQRYQVVQVLLDVVKRL